MGGFTTLDAEEGPPGYSAQPDATMPPCAPDIVAAAQALRIIGGINQARPEDIAFLERTGDGKLTIQDAVSLLRDPCIGPGRDWSIGFTAAQSSNGPAIVDVDRAANGFQEVVFTSDYQNPALYNADPYRAGNPQQIFVVSDTTGSGDYGFLTGWPRPLRDAPNGVSVANVTGNLGSSADPLEVFGINFQDVYGTNSDPNLNIYSHLYGWTALGGKLDVNGDGVQDFANEQSPDNPNGIGTGHSAAPAAIHDLNNDGTPEIFFTFQGQLSQTFGGYVGGGLKIYEPFIMNASAAEPTLLAATDTDPSQGWYVRPLDAFFNTSPVFPNLDTSDDTPSVTRHVAAASLSGYIYAWDAFGNAAPGWEPVNRLSQYTYDTTDPTPFTDFSEYVPGGSSGGAATRDPAPLYTPIAAGDVNVQTGDEVVAASGNMSAYWGFPYALNPNGSVKLSWPYHTQDGAVYCWNTDGTLRWRYPAYVPSQRIQSFLPAFTSGVSIGRLNGSGGPASVVVGDVEGAVYALNVSTGALQWKFQTHQAVHIAFRPVRTQPLIFDVNGDGYQDVVVGNSDGYVYALKGNTSNPNGEEMWHARTFPTYPANTPFPHDTETAWPDGFGHLYQERHYEEARGLAVGNLYGNDPTRAAIVVTSGVNQIGVPQYPVKHPPTLGGHMLILDLGPGTWNPAAADWPQLGRTAQRTGTLGLP